MFWNLGFFLALLPSYTKYTLKLSIVTGRQIDYSLVANGCDFVHHEARGRTKSEVLFYFIFLKSGGELFSSFVSCLNMFSARGLYLTIMGKNFWKRRKRWLFTILVFLFIWLRLLVVYFVGEVSNIYATKIFFFF